MKAVCKVCSHPERAAIDASLRAGTAYRVLAQRHGMSLMSLSRHSTGGHISAGLVTLPAPVSAAPVATVDQGLDGLYARVEAILRKAETDDHMSLGLAAAKELRALEELRRKVKADEPPAVIDLGTHPQWLAIRSAMLEAFARWEPDWTGDFYGRVRRELAAALANLPGAGNGHVDDGRDLDLTLPVSEPQEGVTGLSADLSPTSPPSTAIIAPLGAL